MLAFLRCVQCQGKKKIAPLGFIEKECPSCHGIGHIVQSSKDESTISQRSIIATPVNNSPVRRRGRPSRKLIND
jgi:phage FluMu protein Com